MKYIIALSLCLLSILSYGQEIKAEFDGHKWEAPYQLNIPNGWTIERFLVPISFAPQIAYKGVEDIRFAPGWANTKSDEYWTYAFLWYLDDAVKTTAPIIEENLQAYYTGLFKVNTDSSKLVNEKIKPVTTSFKRVTTSKGDIATFHGTVEMMDYMQMKPLTLHCIAHWKFCEEVKKYFLFYELSPQPFTHANWKSLDELWLTFKCSKS
jgi:hypothetical protein